MAMARSRILAVVLTCSALITILEAAQRGKWIPSYAGRYLIQVSRTYNCPDSDWEPLVWLWLRTSHWNPYKPGELQVLNGNVSNAIDIVNEHWLTVTCDARNNNQWKPNFLRHSFPKDACSLLRRFFPDACRAIYGEPQGGACSLPTGNYTVTERSIDWSVPDVPVLPYGTYRLHVQAGKPGRKQPYLCFSLEGTAFPKPQ